MPIEKLILEAYEEWKKTGRLPNGEAWQPSKLGKKYEDAKN